MRNRILTVLGVSLVISIALWFLGFRSTKLHISFVAEPIYCLFGERTTASLEVCASGFPITNGLITTVIIDLLLIATIIFGVRNMKLIPRGFQNLVEAGVEAFYNFAQSIDRKNVAKFFPFCASVFFFALYANLFGLLPGVGSIGTCTPYDNYEAAEPSSYDGLPLTCASGETLVPFFRAPSADLNTTIAWALVSVGLIQYFGFQALGLGYLTKFFNFREGFMGAFVGILELVSEFVRIIAFSFRLFGNIFAGEVLLVVMAFLFSFILPIPFYLFEVFVAFMQAFIFGVLSLVFMSLATISHGDHGAEGAH
ncbi:MAG: ATP synthase F0 subunit A [Chloroflexi bacterium AL-W]|nr:ATP synthase F0 subunit A [Chloroflexi bacterium AL-N1]NOK64966.1 ATP synthase F0 subunit A [Chloroflexi bacterium AL-N10]NOK76736.1 ATP synthase F0 subunit A [Chloroflexi bacterium AL-N5]NOK84627.1 ATP synthase F0 subunit A [Chloroflexi bacterium AL-W]NOK86548.1 ATP synthase F0 subunit A [Chloroflexi bacterium AL-N15]